MRLAQTKEILQSSGLPDDVLAACLGLVDWIEFLGHDQAQFLTLAQIEKALPDVAEPDAILAALSILSTSEFSVLEVHGYLDDFESGPMTLADEDFRSAMMDGILAHPKSGELIERPREHVRLFYSMALEVVSG